MKYMRYVIDLLEVILKEEEKQIAEAAALLTDKILKGKSVFVFGASHAGILTEEAYFRAGGLVVMNPIFAKSLQLDSQPITLTSEMERLPGHGRILAKKSKVSEGDVVIVHSVSGRNPVGVEFAETLKDKGAIIISFVLLFYPATNFICSLFVRRREENEY